MIDWSIGRYEETAAQLLPVARAVVEAAAPLPGERVVDVGCGTGNATLVAAALGARVTGVDPARRLLGVARERAAAEGLDVAFVEGTAASLPVEDAGADLVLSVFAVIFAPDPAAAAREMARVTAPGGRIVLSAWLPAGPVAEVNRIAGEAVARALGTPAGPPSFRWHERDALAELFEPHGFHVAAVERTVALTAPSVQAFIEAGRQNPVAVAGSAVLEPRGELEPVLDRWVEVLEAANEDPDAFKVSSPYIIATARRRR